MVGREVKAKYRIAVKIEFKVSEIGEESLDCLIKQSGELQTAQSLTVLAKLLTYIQVK
jgi:hypothetical protein